MRAERPYWFCGSLGARRMNQLIEKELRKLFRKMFRLFGNAESYISKIIKKHNASNVQVFAL
jgi:UDP-N-acetylglucosamine:LPS N-acetylglucosamine transferase